jgi:hypothetical protein
LPRWPGDYHYEVQLVYPHLNFPVAAGTLLIEVVKQDLVTGPAERAAEALLLSRLSEDQQRLYRLGHWFTVTTPSGNQYMVDCRRGYIGNVHYMLGGMAARTYCIHLVHHGGYWPLADHWLAQVMLLMTNEQQFLSTAYGT